MKEKDRIKKRVDELVEFLKRVEFREKMLEELEKPDRGYRTAPKKSRGREVQRDRVSLLSPMYFGLNGVSL